VPVGAYPFWGVFGSMVIFFIWIAWFMLLFRVFGEFALQSPEMLSNMRILPPWLDFYSDKFDDASPAHEAEMAQMVKGDVEVLHRYDRNALDRDGQLVSPVGMGEYYAVLASFLGVRPGDVLPDDPSPIPGIVHP